MKTARLEWFPYEVPLVEPLRIGAHRLATRRGVLVRATTEQGAVGWGDAAPLPGFSRESAEDVQRELERGEGACSSSTRFAVESAVASASAAEAGVSLGSFLLGRTADHCAVNALIAEEPEAWADRACALVAEGFSVIKLKVGRAPMSLELACLRAAVEAAPGVRLRLDANRAWSTLVARGFAQEVEGLPIAYIEEPVRAGCTISAEWPASIPVAWDETLQETDAMPLAHEKVTTWVIKPTLAGGLTRAVRLVDEAAQRGVSVVFSSAYESGVGVRVLAELAAATGGVAGLDTYRALAEDVLTPRLEMTGGVLDLRVARQRVVKIK